jgi:ribosome biogenesis GTPase
MRLKGLRSTNPIAVGDWVQFEKNENGPSFIHEIVPRTNYILRKATNLSKEYHIIAANVDLAILVVTLREPETSTRFIDRFLITCEAYQVNCLIVFNKMDLLNDEDLTLVEYYKYTYQIIGYECLTLGMDDDITELKDMLKGKTILFSGHSGVGKTTLINRLDPSLNLKTTKVSTQHKTGKHTTTHAEMFDFMESAKLIDTPGIKSFGVIDFEKEELYHYFPEIFKFAEGCKFHNCLHKGEPGCAVVEAVENEEIEYFRYESYIQILEDPEEKYR